MNTRVHLLDERVMIAAIKGEPEAWCADDRRIRITGTDLSLMPRQARQLAYSLCEAADAAEDEDA
jgi:hypothetical protein